MQKQKAIPSKFFFGIQRALIKVTQAGSLKICIRRKDKAVYSKDYPFSADTLEVLIKEKLEFPTTIEQGADGFKSKTAVIQVEFTLSNGSIHQASADVQLTEITGSEMLVRSSKLKGESHNAQVDFECSSTLAALGQPQFKSASNIQSTNPEFSIRQDPNETAKSSKQFGLQVRRKEKTLLVIHEDNNSEASDIVADARAFATCETSQVTKGGLKRSNTTLQFGMARAREFTFGEAAEQEARKNHTPERVGGYAPIKQEDYRKEEIEPPRKQSTSLGKFNTSTSIEEKIRIKVDDSSLLAIRKLNDEVNQLNKLNKTLQEENKKLSKLNRQLQQKISLREESEQSSQDNQKKLVRRLNQDIDAKNKQIKQIEQELQKQKVYLKHQEDLTAAARKEIDKLILKGSGVSTTSIKDNSKDLQKEIQKLKKDYDQKLKDLQDQNAKLMVINDQKTNKVDICLSKACDNEKKDLKNKLKQIQKSLDQKDVQLQTKERLIKNYQGAKKDRQTDNASIDMSRQMDKWRSERLILQQQIEELKTAKLDKNKGGSDKQDILTLKIEKQTMTRELERLKRTLNQTTKDKQTYENTSQKLQDELISSKQKVVDLLNGIQEHGGMELYDTICKIME